MTDTHKRDSLFAKFFPLVTQTARRMIRRLPPTYELEDLEQMGAIGLLVACSHYDPKRNFVSYAKHWIRGAILDGCSLSYRGSPRLQQFDMGFDTPDLAVPSAEDVAIAAQSVLRLTPAQRKALVLILEGHTQMEAAAALQITQQAAAALLRRARRRLAA